MPDSVVSACNALDGVRVVWISRYAAGGNLFLDLEVVEELTRHGEEALDRVIGMLPVTFRVDWAARLQRTPDGGEVIQATDAAPSTIGWHELSQMHRLPPVDDVTLLCGGPLTEDEIVVVGRDGGPEFLDSELARLGHLLALAVSISRS